jgi:glycolate dehydrogenase FAD-linked subunit
MRAVMGGPAGYGNVVNLGRRTAKGVAGYDLTALMVGSEGTLGVVTEVTLRLRPALTGRPRTVVGAYRSLVDAGTAVAEVTRRGLVPSALELLDRACLTAVEEWKHLGLEADAEALLLARVDTPGPGGDSEAQAVVDAFAAGDPLFAVVSADEAEADALFAARRLAYPALERLGPVLTEDVCVPRSAVPVMLAQLVEIAARHDVTMATIAHAGDGNLHPLLITPPGDEAGRSAAQSAFEEMLDAAIALGGTVTGEHGVGLLKRDGMRRELDPLAVEVQRGIKTTLDPLGIFNPGKVL